MSLINDALKKAQKQRTGDGPDLKAMPAIGGESAVRIARRDKPAGFNTLVLWIGIGVTVLVAAIIGGFFAVRWMTRSPEPKAPAPATVVAAPVPAPTANTASVPTVSTSTSPTTSSSAVTPSAVPTTSSTTPTVVEPKPVAIAPVAPPPEPEPPKLVIPAPKMDSKAIAYIEALRVAGIRASTTDSKVLMNDRVYRTGDTVEHQLGLKLAVINANALTFEDEKGARYTRNF